LFSCDDHFSKEEKRERVLVLNLSMENYMVKEEIVEVIDGEQEEEENVGGDEEDDVVSTLTMERVEAAKKFIENHYRSQMKHIQERKER
jgi:hypothetical protein